MHVDEDVSFPLANIDGHIGSYRNSHFAMRTTISYICKHLKGMRMGYRSISMAHVFVYTFIH